MKTAKGAVMVAANEPFEVRNFELTAAPEGMAKIKLIASGICGTDVHIHRGNNPDMHSSILSLASQYQVEDINKAFDDAKSGKNIKTILTL